MFVGIRISVIVIPASELPKKCPGLDNFFDSLTKYGMTIIIVRERI